MGLLLGDPLLRGNLLMSSLAEVDEIVVNGLRWLFWLLLVLRGDVQLLLWLLTS